MVFLLTFDQCEVGLYGSVESRAVLEVYLDMGVKEPFLMAVRCRAICVAP